MIMFFVYLLSANEEFGETPCNSVGYKAEFNGENFVFFDACHSVSAKLLIQAVLFEDEYKLKNVVFKPGDILIDIGGNIGIFSIPLARKYPFIKIYAFEPVKEFYETFEKNIKANNVSEGIITLVNKAVTKDGRNVKMIIDDRDSLVAAINSFFTVQHWLADNAQKHLHEEDVESITISEIFRKYEIKKCKVFKIDCEGCEYESLPTTGDEVFERIEFFRAEFHKWKELSSQGYSPPDLLDFVESKKMMDVEVDCGGKECKRNPKKGMKFSEIIVLALLVIALFLLLLYTCKSLRKSSEKKNKSQV